MENEEETKPDLDKILTEVAKALNIQNYELRPNVHGDYADGFVSQFFTGEVQNTDTGEKVNVAIKKAPSFGQNNEILFKNEDLFYSAVVPALNLLQNKTQVPKPFDNIPKYFCGSLEPKKEFIAMEYLKPLGYVMFDKTKYFDKEHLDLIFKTYGEFHALSYVLRNKDFVKYQEVIGEFVDFFPNFATMASDTLSNALSSIGTVLRKEEDKKSVHDAVEYVVQNTKEVFLKSIEYHGDLKCIVHGDGWSNNMLFKYLESGQLVDVKIIDFQLCRESSPIHDLSYFFYSGASKNDIDSLESYLKLYYDSFSNFVKELGGDPNEMFSFDVLVNEWKENALMGVLLGVYLWQIKLIAKEQFQAFNLESKDLPMEEQVKMWANFLRKIFESDAFQERAINILSHAFDYEILRKEKFVKK